jgi:2'-5' RNA ligase
MEEIRTFIAIELPEEVKKKLSELEEQLKSARLSAKWVAPTSIHLTLKFLGNITVDSVPGVTRAMEEAALNVAPFQLEVSGIGVFPNPRRVQVVWAGVNGDIDRLLELQKRIDSGLEVLGFVPESRPFTAHLTVARIREEASSLEREAAGRLVTGIQFIAPEFGVDSISLMKSQLRREGPIYTRLVSVPLVG